MNIKFNPPTVVLLFSLSILLWSCRTEPSNTNTDKPTVAYKHVGSKTAYMGMPTKVKTLNPVAHRSPYSEMVFSQMMQPLMNIDPITKQIVPVLAKSKPEVKSITEGMYKGGVAYTYEIKDGAIWNNGTPVTADDVLFTLKSVFAPKVNAPIYPYYFADFVAVEKDANNPKRFTIIADKEYFLGEEASSAMYVMPEYVYDAEKVLRKFTLKQLKAKEKGLAENAELIKFVEAFNSPKYSREIIEGSGAYQLLEWEAGQRIVLTKKKDWWGNTYKGQNRFMTANADTLFYRVLPDQTAMANAVQNEDVDVAFGLNVADFKSMRDNDERLNNLYNFYAPTEYSYYFLYLNTKAPLLEDKNVRRALAHLVDVDFVINNLYDGMASPQPGPVSTQADYFNENLKMIPYDLEKARELLKIAGWTDTDNNGILDKEVNGKRTELKLSYVSSDSKYAANLSAYLKESFKDAGIVLETETMEFNAVRGRLAKREFDLSSGALSCSPIDMDFEQLYAVAADNPRGFNRSGFGNAESDALLADIKVTMDKAARVPLYHKFQEMLYDAQPKIYMFAPQQRIVIHKRFKGAAGGYKPYVHLPSLEFAQ